MKRRRHATGSDRKFERLATSTDNRVAWRVALAILFAAGVCLLPPLFDTASQRRLRQAEAALSRGEFSEAQRLADLVLEQDPMSSQALLVGGHAAAGQQRADLAIGYFERVPDDGSGNAVIALRALGNCAVRLGLAALAEECFRRALQYDPSQLEARDGLIRLLVLENRTWEAQQLILPLFQAGRVHANHLVVTGSTEIWLADVSEFSAACLAAVPGDPLPLLHAAGQAWRANNPQRAEELLDQIVAVHPGNVEAQARLGRILADSPAPAAFLQWHAQLPESAGEHPEIWFDRGFWAQRHGQPAAAARCYWEVILRQPNHTAANYQLSQVLVGLGKSEQAGAFAERAGQLAKLRLMIDGVKSEWAPDQIRQTVQMLESLGRPWEAAGWCHLVLQQDSQATWAASTLLRLSQNLDACATFTLDSHNPARQTDLSTYPLPDWQLDDSSPVPPRDMPAASAQVAFTDSAPEAGLDFTYFNGAVSEEYESLFEMDGGGVAVLDYEGDGWPDLYFTQGGPLPPQQERHGFTDRLFRNLGNGRFEDMTAQAGLGDDGYSQGVTVGDFDNDGFPDLYIANVGPNRFYRNNGDGTFSDITLLAGTAGDAWTSSCLLADLNGDTLPDVYAVNYLGGLDLDTRRCEKRAAKRCAPVDFPAEQDRLYLNLGDGRFEDVTERCGIVAPDGRGLGIVAADLDGSHRLSLFVANDMSANFLFLNQTSTRGGTLAFSERGILSGLAFDSLGVAQACMGIAAGDANEDGLLDLFVTNFYRESNNLYVQQADGLFRDEAGLANLRDAGFYRLGWGTQFLDGELDGLPDLVVANGHVHDPLDANTPHRMPPQYFRNSGGGRFVETRGESVGNYFQGKYLGRALARLDWNRDGLEDFCVTHLDTPAALLTNRTAGHGHFLVVRPIGVASDRDALGTSVRVTAGGRTQVRQLTAGDGYQAANQRQLVFGLGAAERIDRLEVSWPSGLTQEFRDIPADSRLVFIEGHSQEIRMPTN